MNECEFRIGIVCPCVIEYQSCRTTLALNEEFAEAGRTIARSRQGDTEILAIQAGPGKIQCASATQLLIDRFKPEILIDTGAAGSLTDALSIGDILCVTSAFEYDVCPVESFERLSDDLTTHTALQDTSMLESLRDIVPGTRIVSGSIVSGERNIQDSAERRKMHTHFGALACNWETSAVLKTARLNGIRALSFRAISDNADEEMKSSLKENWQTAVEALYSTLNLLISEGWMTKLTTAQSMSLRKG